jgi:hypothetical protein
MQVEMISIPVSSRLTLNVTTDEWRKLESAIFAGKKIEAIKILRAIIPEADLAQAKAYVEKMEQDLRASAPEKFSAPAGKSGCMGLIMLGLGSAGLMAIIAFVGM